MLGNIVTQYKWRNNPSQSGKSLIAKVNPIKSHTFVWGKKTLSSLKTITVCFTSIPMYLLINNTLKSEYLARGKKCVPEQILNNWRYQFHLFYLISAFLISFNSRLINASAGNTLNSTWLYILLNAGSILRVDRLIASLVNYTSAWSDPNDDSIVNGSLFEFCFRTICRADPFTRRHTCALTPARARTLARAEC